MTLAGAFAVQARACAALGSPFMERLLTGLAAEWPTDSRLGRLCTGWPGDIGPGGASLPLRIAGGLHALVLTGRDPALAAVYPPRDADCDALMAAVLAALPRNEDFLLAWLQSPPQTNEVRRSAALIPAAHWIAARHPLPFAISELGASAGLNLMWDRYALAAGAVMLGPPDPVLTLTPDWRGTVPTPTPLTVTDRRGVDLNPLDCHDPDQALRLFAYLWPDQPHRVALTRAAIAAQKVTIDQADAADWLADRLAQPFDGRVHLIFHTIAWQYFPTATQTRATALIETAGAAATDAAPLAWLGLEQDGGTDGAALTLRLWPGDRRIALGRADFHGRWVDWRVV